MAWTTPKTDWKIDIDSAGNYHGDYVNFSDYNRIKNNLEYLISIAPEVVYCDYPALGQDKTSYLQYPYPEEWNDIEDGLHLLATNISGVFDPLMFYENGNTLNFIELNRIESMELILKAQYESAIQMKHRLAFRFGTKSSDIRV